MKRFAFLLAFLCALFPLAAAGNRLVLGGRAVIMVADAVYLFPGAGERVAAIAGADQGLGSFLAAIDPGYAKKPTLDRNAGAEAYAALKPDAIILKSSMKKSLGPSLDALGLRQLYLNLETPEDYSADLRLLGRFLGMERRGDDLVEFYESRVRTIQAAVEKIKPLASPKVLLVQAPGPIGGAWDVPPVSWMQTRLVEMAKGSPVWTKANPGAGWGSINAEQIAAWDPDYVFVVDYRDDSRLSAARFSSTPSLKGVSAVKKGRVFGFPQDFYSWDQPDVRWILGLEWIARKLYPEAFSSFPMMDSARDFFRFMYGFDKENFDRVILPRLSGDY
jgi:iron complex transport system substrate-binding protein